MGRDLAAGLLIISAFAVVFYQIVNVENRRIGYTNNAIHIANLLIADEENLSVSSTSANEEQVTVELILNDHPTENSINNQYVAAVSNRLQQNLCKGDSNRRGTFPDSINVIVRLPEHGCSEFLLNRFMDGCE